MEQQTNQWLKQTLFWQRVILVGIGFSWVLSVLAILSELFFIYKRPDIGELVFVLLCSIIGLVWTGAVVWRLHKSIQSTKQYWETQRSLYWQEAMQHQYHFWKHLVLMLLLGFTLMLLFIAFILFLFAGTP